MISVSKSKSIHFRNLTSLKEIKVLDCKPRTGTIYYTMFSLERNFKNQIYYNYD